MNHEEGRHTPQPVSVAARQPHIMKGKNDPNNLGLIPFCYAN